LWTYSTCHSVSVNYYNTYLTNCFRCCFHTAIFILVFVNKESSFKLGTKYLCALRIVKFYWIDTELGLVIRSTEHLERKHTNNYNTISNLHAETAHPMSQSVMFSSSRCLVTVLTMRIAFTASVLNGSCPRRLATHDHLPLFLSTTTHSQNHSQTESQSYFTSGGLPPISSSLRQAP
jgi:hypothetical protein